MTTPSRGGSLSALSYRAGWGLACRLPERTVGVALRRAADLAWSRRGAGVRQLEANLSRAVPGDDEAVLRDLSQRAMRSYLRYWGEVFRLPRWSAGQLSERVVTRHEERLREPLARGQGVVAALPHMGNWDLAGAWACSQGMPLTTVAERLQPEQLYAEFLRHRNSLGMDVLPLTGGAAPLPVLEQRLAEGGFVCLLADRELSRRGVPVPLLGETARLPIGPALLAARTGAVLLPVTTSYAGSSMRLDFHQPVEVGSGVAGMRAATAGVAAAFTAAIRRDPADWHMLQRVFEADLAARPRRVVSP
ncbi:MAG: phosphatidylinositol mannoside acyltransferase [Nocardioidaceae bacterium]